MRFIVLVGFLLAVQMAMCQVEIDESSSEAPSTGPPPGQPGQGRPPPGQGRPPPGQGRPPPGQGRPPPGQERPPPGQERPPPGQGRPPPPGGRKPPAGRPQNETAPGNRTGNNQPGQGPPRKQPQFTGGK